MAKVIYYSPFGGTVLAVLAEEDADYEERLRASEGGRQEVRKVTVSDAEGAKWAPGHIYVPGGGA